MTTLDLLENLESQLNGFKLEAAKMGNTDIAILIHKFKCKIVELQNDVKAELETAE